MSEALEYGLVGINEGIISTEVGFILHPPTDYEIIVASLSQACSNAGCSIWRCQAVRSWKGRFQVWDGRIPGSKLTDNVLMQLFLFFFFLSPE